MDRTIDDLDCRALEWVLGTCFDAGELTGLLRDDGPACPAHAVLRAHQACHERAPAAARLQSMLDAVHADTVRTVREMDPVRAAELARAAGVGPQWGFTGLLWALVTDPRPEVRPAAELFMQRVSTHALRALSFGEAVSV